ncbi:MAG: hypothetical protein WA268_27820 [Xanthobacteraceae bacterium]
MVGWAEKNRRFDGLYLGRAEKEGLVYAGKLKRGISDEDSGVLLKRLNPLRVSRKPMRSAPGSFPKARWVKPTVLVDAEFPGRTGEGLLRHPSYKGVREDLKGPRRSVSSG